MREDGSTLRSQGPGIGGESRSYLGGVGWLTFHFLLEIHHPGKNTCQASRLSVPLSACEHHPTIPNPQQQANPASGPLYLRAQEANPTPTPFTSGVGRSGRESSAVRRYTYSSNTPATERAILASRSPTPPRCRLTRPHSPRLPAPFSRPGRASLLQPSPESSVSPLPPVLARPGHSRSMEPGEPLAPGESRPGAEAATAPRWEEAKAFYDNLAPKKKPKSVNTRHGHGGRAEERSPGEGS